MWWWLVCELHQLTPQDGPTSKDYYYPLFTREGTEAHASDTTSKVPEAVVAQPVLQARSPSKSTGLNTRKDISVLARNPG